MFKQLLNDTKKNHETESTIDSKHYDYDNIENVARAIKKTKGEIDQFGIVVKTKNFD